MVCTVPSIARPEFLHLSNNASEQQDLHFLSHPDKCVNLIDIDLSLPISAIQSDYSWQHLRRSIHPMGIDIDIDSPLPPPISATQEGDHSR